MASVPAAHRSFVASCLFNSLFPSLICHLSISILSSVKGIASKIAKSQNQSAKLATRKQFLNASYSGEDAYAQSKRKSQFANETVQWSQSGWEEEPHKAKRFKKNHGERKTLPHCTRCSKTSQPLWNEVSIAVRPE